jgi:hypothetical protein
MRNGHEAQLARLRGEPQPKCPYKSGTKSHHWWHHGADRIAPMVDKILELHP